MIRGKKQTYSLAWYGVDECGYIYLRNTNPRKVVDMKRR